MAAASSDCLTSPITGFGFSLTVWAGPLPRTPRSPIRASALQRHAANAIPQLLGNVQHLFEHSFIDHDHIGGNRSAGGEDDLQIAALDMLGQTGAGGGFQASKPGGRRKRISRALPLTLLISHCQCRPSLVAGTLRKTCHARKRHMFSVIRIRSGRTVSVRRSVHYQRGPIVLAFASEWEPSGRQR